MWNPVLGLYMAAKEAGKFHILTGQLRIQVEMTSKEEGEEDIGRPLSVSASRGKRGR